MGNQQTDIVETDAALPSPIMGTEDSPQETASSAVEGADSTTAWAGDGAGGDATEIVADKTQAAPELAWSADDARAAPAPYRQPWAKALLVAAAILVPLTVVAAIIAVPRWMSQRNSPAPSAARPTSLPVNAGAAPHGRLQPEDLAAATVASQEKADRHASGDFAGEWLLYVRNLREGITQQDFVHYSQVCSRTGLKLKATGVRMDGNDRAIVRLELLGGTRAYTWAYEDGAWYQMPDDFLSSNFGKSGDQLIAADKGQGHCLS